MDLEFPMSAEMQRNAVRNYLPPVYWDRETRSFSQQIDFNTLAASAIAQPGSFQQNNGQDFLCLAVSEIITTDATGATEQEFPEHLVLISETSSGYQWTNGFVHAANFFGRSPVNGQPTPLPWPQLVLGGETVQVLATNLEANARRIWMQFHGVLIFRGDWVE